MRAGPYREPVRPDAVSRNRKGPTVTEESADAGLTAAEREAIEGQLAREERELREEVTAAEESEPLLRADCDLDAADAGAKGDARDRLHSRIRHARSRLAEVEGALDRLRTGSFGVCARCSRPVGPDRLRAKPTAELCLACQNLREGAEGSGSRARRT